jgi:N12 class adenine-specific DNA methylase
MKRIYKKDISKNIQIYKNSFGKTIELKFTKTELEIEGFTEKKSYYTAQIKSIIEIQDYFFICLQPEVVIIPKRELNNVENIKENLISLSNLLNFEFKTDLNWKW